MINTFSTTKRVTIGSSPTRVWEALTRPDIVKQYMFGTEVVSNWQKGGSLIYKGHWDGQPFEDKGTILEIEPGKLLKASLLQRLERTRRYTRELQYGHL